MNEETFSAGTATVVPGQKARGVLEVPGTDLRLPLTLVCGRTPGPTVLVTAGVHGGEYPGIEAAIRLARELDPAQVRGRVAIVHICGISAFHARMQYLTPEDGKNPNRVYPGRATGTVSERLAYTIMETFVARADAWVDLHGGDIHESLWPFTIHSARGPSDVASRARAMADVFGIRHIIVSESISGGTYGAAAARSVPAILVEAGGVGQLDEESVAIHLRGLHNVLRLLGVLPGSPQPAQPPVRLSRFDWLRAEQAGCWYPAVQASERVRAGQVAGTIKDYWGETLADYRVPADGVVLFVVTSLAINPGDPLVGIGVV